MTHSDMDEPANMMMPSERHQAQENTLCLHLCEEVRAGVMAVRLAGALGWGHDWEGARGGFLE